MRLEFSIYRDRSFGEFGWGWNLLDKDKQDNEVASNFIFSQKEDNLESIKSIISKADGRNIETKKLGDKEPNKSANGLLTLNIKEDDTWYISKGEQKLVVGVDLLSDKKDIEIFLRALGKAKSEFLNPEDDPANQAKTNDDTKATGIEGS